MSESERVQRWRQRQRAAGKEPLTIWLTSAEKLRLEDQALSKRCSPSELVQQALAQWHGESSSVTDTVTDTRQLRVLVQHELALTQNVTDTVTDAVTVTAQQMLPALVRALLQEQQPWTATATVTDTVTDTNTSTGEDLRPDAAPERIADTVTVTDTATVVLPMTYPVTVATTDAVIMPMTASITDTVADTTAAPPAKRKARSRQRTVTDIVSDTVTVTGQKHRGRKPVLRPGILAVLDEHPDGLTAAQLKVYLGTEKHIGDTLAGMVKAQLLVRNGTGQGLRYQLADVAGKDTR